MSANSDGSIKIVGNKPADEDLQKNKDVMIKIEVNGKYLSLADAVVSSQLSQPVTNQAFLQERISSRN